MEFIDDAPVPTGRKLLDVSLETDLAYKTPVVYRILKLLQQESYLPAYGCHMAELCLEEALANAMVHGNQLQADKKLNIGVFAGEQQFGVVIEDEGEGFGPEDVPDPKDPESILRERGRGIMLMDHYMDQVQYSRSGTRLCMVRRRQVEPDPGAVPPRESSEVEPIPADGTIEAVPIGPIDAESPTLARVSVPDQIELELPGERQPPAGPVTIEQVGDVFVAQLHAPRIAEENAAEIGKALDDVAAQAQKLVLDMSEVQFMSSIALGRLVALFKKMTQKKGRLILSSLQSPIENVLTAAGMMRLFKVEANCDQAVEKIR